MTAPASGLWGPGDYGDDFVTIDEAMEVKDSLFKVMDAMHSAGWAIVASHEDLFARVAIRDAILDMAEDLAERDLRFYDLEGLREMQRHAWKSGCAFGQTLPPEVREPAQPPSPEIPPPQNPF